MKSDLVYLLHIQEFCNDIIEYIKCETNSFDDFKNKYPNIPFKEIKGIRNILIHEYFGVDYNIVYKTAIEEIPKLKKQIDKIIENETKS